MYPRKYNSKEERYAAKLARARLRPRKQPTSTVTLQEAEPPEGFLPVPGYAGIFASRDGRVYMSPRTSTRSGERSTRFHAGRVLLQSVGTDGYFLVRFWTPNKGHYSKAVHILIALTYCNRPETDERLEVDHINRLRTDNRAENLRWLTHAQNNWNKGPRSDSPSGVPGVRFHITHQLWHSLITVNKRVISLGYSKDKEVAISRRKAAEKQYWGEEFA